MSRSRLGGLDDPRSRLKASSPNLTSPHVARTAPIICRRKPSFSYSSPQCPIQSHPTLTTPSPSPTQQENSERSSINNKPMRDKTQPPQRMQTRHSNKQSPPPCTEFRGLRRQPAVHPSLHPLRSPCFPTSVDRRQWRELVYQ